MTSFQIRSSLFALGVASGRFVPESILAAVIRRVTPGIQPDLLARVRDNLAKLGWADPSQILRLESSFLATQSKVLSQVMRLHRIPYPLFRQNIRLVNTSIIEQALRERRGVLAIGGHTGNWVHTVSALGQAGYPVSVIVHEVQVPTIVTQYERCADRFNWEIILVGDSAAFKIRKALARNRIVIIFFDAPVRIEGHPRFVFGPSRISIDLGPARLAHLLHPFLIWIEGRFEMDGTSTVHLETLPEPDQSPEDTTACWLRQLFKTVFLRPDQWWPLGYTSLGESR